MKPRNILNNRLLIVLLTAGLTVGLISWDYQQTPGQFEQSFNDTTPKKSSLLKDGKNDNRDKKVRNLDDVLEELNAAELKMNKANIQQVLAEAMKGLDQEKMNLQMAKAMSQIDLAKIQKEVQESLAKVDFSKMQKELALAMKNIDMANIQKEVQESIAKVDWDNIKVELAKVQHINLTKIQEEMKELGPMIEKEMNKAKIEIEKSRTAIKEYKSFIDELDSDGLIDKKSAYSLKHEGGELYINGEKASQKNYLKYRSFLEKHKKFYFNKKNDDFKFDID